MGIRHTRPYLEYLPVLTKVDLYKYTKIPEEALLIPQRGGIIVNSKKLFLGFPETEHMRYMQIC